MSDWEVERGSMGGITSIRIRGFELLAGEARSLEKPGAAPWQVTLGEDRVRVEPARFELAQSMVWPFRHEHGMEVVVRGKNLTLPSRERLDLDPMSSVRLSWPSSGIGVSVGFDAPRLNKAALMLCSGPPRVELLLGPGQSRAVRQLSWFVVVRDGSGAPTIEVVDYNPAWPAHFEEERVTLKRALGEQLVAVDHGGSTSVPGLAAKPIIDMWAALRSPLRQPDIDAMAAIGYEYLGELGLADQDLFVKRSPRVCHVHCYRAGHPELDRHLAFRDWLRAHPEGAAAYRRLKRELARRFAADPMAYTDAKSDFIEDALSR